MHTEQENGCCRDGSGRHQNWLSPHSTLLAVGLSSLKSLGAPHFCTEEAEILLYFCHPFICYPPSFIYLILFFFPFGGCILFLFFLFLSFFFDLLPTELFYSYDIPTSSTFLGYVLLT